MHSLPKYTAAAPADAGGDAGDIVDYIAFRAICLGWRACTLRDPRLRPRAWVALCGGDAARPDDAREILFFHKRTARRVRVRPPELRCYRIVGFTDGLVVLLHRSSTAVRVLHPFNHVAVDFPPLAPVYRQDKEVGVKMNLLDMNAVVCGSANSADSIAVVVWFPWTRVLLAAEPADSDWKLLHRGPYVQSMLPFKGKLYAKFSGSSDIVQLYPPRPPEDYFHMPVARVPDIFSHNISCQLFLVESGGSMLLVVMYPRCYADWPRQVGFRLYEVHLRRRSIGKLIPVSSIGDHVLFFNMDRCLSVSARDLSSPTSNSIYLSTSDSPVALHSLRTGSSEQLSDHCQIHDMVNTIRPSVRLFTIVDHLFTYCHPREWTEGLMFHE